MSPGLLVSLPPIKKRIGNEIQRRLLDREGYGCRRMCKVMIPLYGFLGKSPLRGAFCAEWLMGEG